jgi:maltooligosyltrehalose trehalohydrolase
VPDPQSEAIFNASKLSWKLNEAPGLFNFYQYLIAFRKARPALQNFRRYEAVRNIRIQNSLLQFERHGNNDVLNVCLNFGQEPVSLVLEQSHNYKTLIDSSGKQWEGPGSLLPAVVHPAQPILINPLSAIVFEQSRITDEE